MSEDPASRLQKMIPPEVMAAATRAALRRVAVEMTPAAKINRAQRRRKAAIARDKP